MMVRGGDGERGGGGIDDKDKEVRGWIEKEKERERDKRRTSAWDKREKGIPPPPMARARARQNSGVADAAHGDGRRLRGVVWVRNGPSGRGHHHLVRNGVRDCDPITTQPHTKRESQSATEQREKKE